MDDPVGELSAITDLKLLAPNPVVVLRDDVRSDLLTPFVVELQLANRSCRAFGYRSADFNDEVAERVGESLLTAQAVLSPRVASALKVEQDDKVSSVSFSFPNGYPRLVVSGVAEDLPDDVSVQFAKSDLALEGIRSRGWALATFGGMLAPVRLVPRRHVGTASPRVRVGMAMRMLWGIPRGANHEICLTPIRRDSVWRYATNSRRVGFVEGRALRVLVAAVSMMLLLSRALDRGLESVLRLLLRAPKLALRTSQAPPGDDVTEVVRLHGSAFPLLGIDPGDQVILSWGPRKAIAVALELIPSSSGLASSTSRTELLRNLATPDLPEHLTALVSSSIRVNLQCPASTVIVVRRRVRPVLVANLTQLVIPFAGLVIAGTAIPNPPRLLLGLAFALMVFLVLAPARRSRPPRGSWP